MDRILIRLGRSAWGRGLAGDHWAWLVIGVALYVLRRARRTGGTAVISMPIKPGERYLVTLSDSSAGDAPGA